ncbi:MAG: glucose-6-phosphate isomerase [Parachlamydiales bacterium]|nr:glucose-6-phosphate isomerase [Parachlamydiales bacterium]
MSQSPTGSFQQTSAYKKLEDLAKTPFDLAQEGNLTADRINAMTAHAGPFKLSFGTERVTEDVMNSLFELASETGAVSKMQRMQMGDILNQIEGYESENRAVLHTAMRDFFGNQQTGPRAAQAMVLAKAECEKLKTFLSKVDGRFTDLVLVGIGGSDLGPRAIYMALQAYKKKGKRVHFISNVDPDDAALVLETLNLDKTMVVVVSKSGNTLETQTNEELVRERYNKAHLKPENHFVAVTGKGSPMDNPSNYLASFYIWDYIGGRYSATSMVGGVMLAFGLGFDNYMEFLRGAHDMDQIALQDDPKKNLPLLAALLGIWNRNFLKLPTLAIIPYSQALVRFTAHLQQCDMESNGKHIDKSGHEVDFHTGPIVWGEPGTNGQHSFYQLIHQGTDTIALEFIGFTETQYGQDLKFKGTTCQEKLIANLLAQSIALAIGQKSDNPNKRFCGNRPNSVLLAKRLDPYVMGNLLAYYEHKVAFQGFMWNINSFDQEGVQLGKLLATKILDVINGQAKQDSFTLGSALLNLMM